VGRLVSARALDNHGEFFTRATLSRHVDIRRDERCASLAVAGEGRRAQRHHKSQNQRGE